MQWCVHNRQVNEALSESIEIAKLETERGKTEQSASEHGTVLQLPFLGILMGTQYVENLISLEEYSNDNNTYSNVDHFPFMINKERQKNALKSSRKTDHLNSKIIPWSGHLWTYALHGKCTTEIKMGNVY